MAGDPFLSDPSKKRKRANKTSSTVRKSRSSKASSAAARNKRNTGADSRDEDDITDGSSSDERENANGGDDDRDSEELSSDEEFANENATDKRRRLAQQYLDNLKNQEFDGVEEFDAQDLDDDILARRLQVDVAEGKGYVYKFIGAKVATQIDDDTTKITTTRIGSKNLTALAARYPHLYTVSKDAELIRWNISLENKKPQRIKHTKGGKKHLQLSTTNMGSNGHCQQINCVAVSPDGKYVVTGGMDSRLIIWSSENLVCLKVLETRSPVNSIVFRRGTDQLYAACADLKIRTYSINQFAQLEILYGHQDNITDISAMAKETCVSVGSRDKTAMFWKISEESRLTFRGGDFEKPKKKKKEDESDEPFYNEGSIDVVSMTDESKFMTGSDNGNVAFWSLAKKKALFTQRLAHGLQPEYAPTKASAELSVEKASLQVPQRQPYPITAIHNVPFSDLFVTGSYNGSLKVWKIDENMRGFKSIGEISNVKGCVVGIESVEVDNKVIIFALVSKEHKFGRWLGKIEGGRNALISFEFDV